MNRHSLWIILACVIGMFPQGLKSQILSSSQLPIVVIQTKDEASIPDEPKILGTMGIIDNGEGKRNHLTDPFNHYQGNIGIETRGNSTQDFDKKTYSVELRTSTDQDTSISLLGMGREEDWILHAMVIDKTQLRIPMSFYLFRRMGHYAANWRYVELVLNGDYRGLYILTERIKRDNDRVDIAKLGKDDVSGDAVTGGYILRIDWLDDPEGFRSKYRSQGQSGMFYQWYYPKAEDIQPAQADYIKSYVTDFEDAVFSPTFSNPKGQRYDDLINVRSFVDFLLINELSKNADGYKLSTYMHKDRNNNGGKLTAGPIWDFDQTYGMSQVCSNDKFNGWTYQQSQPGCEDLESMPMWWRALMTDSIFVDHLRCRWDSLRQGVFREDSLTHWIDTHRALIAEAIDRNYQRWDDVIGEQIWIEPYPIPQTYDAEISYLKNWIGKRLTWIDGNIGECGEGGILETPAPGFTSFLIYPNPAQSSMFVRGSTGNRIVIYNFVGQKMMEFKQVKIIEEVDISTFSQGMYFVSQVGEEEIFQTKKLMIRRP
ncbi:MAG: CotH kinase family protein [Bacteroidota bacterium]